MKSLSPIYVVASVMAFAIVGKVLVTAVEAAVPANTQKERDTDSYLPGNAKDDQAAEPVIPISCPKSSSELAEKLASSAEAYRKKSAMLEQRETDLSRSEETINTKLEELRALKDDLRKYVAIIEKSANEDITALAAMYAAMKPQQAGALFDKMAPDFAAGFLRSMNPEAAADILASMDTSKAYAVSVHIAGQSARKSSQLR